MNLVFSSKVRRQSREAVEGLFFLNPRQHRVRAGIIDALEKFGHPRLEEDGDSIYLRIGKEDAQILFAFDTSQNSGDPIGVVVYLRSSPAEIIVVHLAVHPDYALQGRRGGLGLALVLIDKVKEVASRIVGVERVVLYYQREIIIRL